MAKGHRVTGLLVIEVVVWWGLSTRAAPTQSGCCPVQLL